MVKDSKRQGRQRVPKQGNRPILVRFPDWLFDWVQARAQQNRRDNLQQEIVETFRTLAISESPPQMVDQQG